jgi:Protein of unknown function (DUF1638)
MGSARGALVIACGALAREIAALRRVNGWTELDVCYLPPQLHNRPERIAGEVQEQIRVHRDRYQRIFVAYGDCGTGGGLDAMLRAEGVERIPGAHCYEFFASPEVFAALCDAEPGTFYLTDFLVRHFDHLVTGSLGLDRHPELAPLYFGNYRRVVYLAQSPSEALLAKAQSIAVHMGLEFKFQFTGYGGLGSQLQGFLAQEVPAPWQT